MIYLTFLSAILLSGIAAYYSVIGLASIFTGAFWPVVFMGSVLEMSKLVTASWLYRNWKKCPILLKGYLSIAVVILMLITSMGIFGFLAKSHINSTIDLGANQADLMALNQQEKLANDKLTYLLARAKDPSTASNKLDNQIQDVQRELRRISKDRLPLVKESNTLSVEVGPIKYVAELVYGASSDSIDKAVRLVIMLIMSVFDPLAVLLLIAANISLKQKEDEKLSQQTQIDHEQIVDSLPTDQVQPIHEEVEEIHNDELPKLSPDEEVVLEKLKESGELEIDKTIEMVDDEPVANTIVQEPEEIIKQTTHLAPGVYMEEHVPVDKKKRKK
jgi:hypothetical protein